MHQLINKNLVHHLKNKHVPEPGIISRLKISYRPYICPFKELLEDLPEGQKVFDIGCGSGMFLSLVAEFRNPKAIAGIEIDQKLINNANQIFISFIQKAQV